MKARLPQLGETVQGFEALVLEAEELQSAQDVYRSKLREATLRSQGILRRERSFRNRLAAGVQSVFGIDSMALLALRREERLQKPRRRLTPIEKVAKLGVELAVAKAAVETKEG